MTRRVSARLLHGSRNQALRLSHEASLHDVTARTDLRLLLEHDADERLVLPPTTSRARGLFAENLA